MSIQLEIPGPNGSIVKINGASDKEIIAQAAFWMEMPAKCGCCGDTRLRFDYRTPQDYKFYSLKCRKCGAEYQFGQHKEGGTLFHKREWTPQDQQGGQQNQGQGQHHQGPPNQGYQQQGPPPQQQAYQQHGPPAGGQQYQQGDDDIPF